MCVCLKRNKKTVSTSVRVNAAGQMKVENRGDATMEGKLMEVMGAVGLSLWISVHLDIWHRLYFAFFVHGLTRALKENKKRKKENMR